MNFYISYIGDAADQLVGGPWNPDRVLWVREADLSNLAAYDPSDFYPPGPIADGNLAAVVASLPTDLAAQGIDPNDTRWVMWDFEEWGASSKYPNGDESVVGYDEGAQFALSGVLNEATNNSTARFGLHLTPYRLPYGYARTAGHFEEHSSFAGALDDLAWYGALLVANNGVMFAWLYLTYNIGDTDGSGACTTSEAYNYAYNNARYYLDAAEQFGLTADDVLFYTWHKLVDSETRPSMQTLAQVWAGLEDAGALHWCVALGTVTEDTLDSVNAYLQDVAALLAGDPPDNGGTDDGGSDDCDCSCSTGEVLVITADNSEIEVQVLDDDGAVDRQGCCPDEDDDDDDGFTPVFGGSNPNSPATTLIIDAFDIGEDDWFDPPPGFDLLPTPRESVDHDSIPPEINDYSATVVPMDEDDGSSDPYTNFYAPGFTLGFAPPGSTVPL